MLSTVNVHHDPGSSPPPIGYHRLCKFFVLQILQDKNVKKMTVTNIHLPEFETGSCKETVGTRFLCFSEARNVKK
ncbi:hypothetical protein IGI04_010313 [Brassica rapa subsp. trilocularis]|uniref:Uncharacterized protein n=1 Tax=Brassica rapa subsp. trilocularis TaxID=1813537 RepID=A0ABQ7MZT8_BRACM|nr:hypothetical protein IGI04_010313 [Brassica rapa subsp. trilocularis]